MDRAPDEQPTPSKPSCERTYDFADDLCVQFMALAYAIGTHPDYLFNLAPDTDNLRVITRRVDGRFTAEIGEIIDA